MQMPRGQFVTFEGIDGAGKSTHIQWLKTWLIHQHIPHFFTREPGGTPLAEKVRLLILNEKMDKETETLLMFAARKTHIEEIIRPKLQQGIWVISDRFTDATYAYQGGGRGVDWTRIAILENWVQEDIQPDLTLLFDITAKVSAARLASARLPDRFEQEKSTFFDRVRAAYAQRLAEDPQRMVCIDAEQNVETIQMELESIFEAYLANVKAL